MKFCHGGRAKGSIAEMEIRMRSSSILFFFFRPVETRTVSELKWKDEKEKAKDY